MKYLLDTCLLSELIKPAPVSSVLNWMGQRQNHELFISALTLAELQRGFERLAPSRRRDDLSAWLQQVEASFADRVLPFTHSTAHCWARLCAKAEAAGQYLAVFDSLIAATALEHGLAIATRNVRDFAQAPVVLVNPWDATS